MDLHLARYNIGSLGYSERNFGYGYVYNDGDDNRFPDYVNGLFNTSVTHQAIVNDLVDYIYGKGLVATSEEEQDRLDQFFPKSKLKQAIRSKLVQNRVIFDVMKSKLGTPLWFKFIDSSLIRVSELKEDMPVKFLYRKSWDQNKYQLYNQAREYWRITEDKYEGLYYWFDSGTFEVPYGRPKYMSAFNAIELEASIYQMHNHGAQNGMFPSFFMEMETSGDPEVDKKTEENIFNQISGTANAGKGMVRFRPAGADNQMTISTPSMTGVDKVYEGQYAQAEIGILKGHQIPSPTLISGLNTKSSGFSNPAEEMEYALKILQEKRIEPEREEIISILRPLLDMIEVGEVEFKGEEITIVDTPSVGAETEEVNEELTEVDESVKGLTGRELQRIESIANKFKKGKYSKEQADSLLRAYGFKDKHIDLWLQEDSVEKFSEMLSKVKFDVDALIALGEEEDLKGYELIESQSIEGIPSNIDYNIEKFSQAVKSNFDSKSEQDTPLFKVRYKYKGETKADSREFCRKMVSADRVYRFEDLDAAEALPVNPGFGPGGSNNYSIWLYKGGVNCYHFFERRVYLRRSNRNISVNEARRIVLALPPDDRDENRLQVNDPRVARRPIDMPNKARLKLSKVLTAIKEL